MSVVGNIESASKNPTKGPRVRGKNITVAMLNTNDLTRRFLKKDYPDALRQKLMMNAVTAAARVMQKATKVELSGKRSRYTGSRKGWSESERAMRAGFDDLYLSTEKKVIEYEKDKTVYGMVGREKPNAWYAILVEFGGYHPLWGREGFEIYEPPFPYMRRAAAASGKAQRDVAEAEMKRNWDKV